MLAYAMEIVSESCECKTSHLAITAIPVKHGTNFVLPDAATSPKPIGQEPMDLSVASTNTRCYHYNGYGHEEHHSVTLDTQWHGQAFYATTGGNRSRWDGDCNLIDTHCGSAGTSAGSAAGSINRVQAATAENANVNDDGVKLAAKQEVGGTDNHEGNGSWE